MDGASRQTSRCYAGQLDYERVSRACDEQIAVQCVPGGGMKIGTRRWLCRRGRRRTQARRVRRKDRQGSVWRAAQPSAVR